MQGDMPAQASVIYLPIEAMLRQGFLPLSIENRETSRNVRTMVIRWERPHREHCRHTWDAERVCSCCGVSESAE